MSAITMETSYVNSDGDMGQAHINSHARQHDYLMSGEQEVIVLSNTKLEDTSQDLAMQKAIEQGVKTEDEWKEYNSKLMPSRQKESYQEYIKSLSNNYTKNIQRQLNKGTLTTAKKDKNYQSLKAIERNGGLAVEGDLYYLGNVDDYKNKSDDELKRYREFQVKTLTLFYYSDIFQKLNKGCFRGEIHQDEKGAIHLQTQGTNYHMNSRGRVEMATGACKKEALIELYGSEEELNKRLDLLQAAHNANDKNKKKGVFRTDAVYWDDNNQKLIGKVKPATKGKRRMRIPELYRMEQMHELGRIARETAKQYNIDYNVDRKYTTDGVHKTAAGYASEQKSKEKADKIIEDAKKKANKIIDKALGLKAKAEQERKELEKERKKQEQKNESLFAREQAQKNRDEVFNGKMLDILAPNMHSATRDELFNDGAINIKERTPTGTVKRRYSIDEYIGLQVDKLKTDRDNTFAPVEQRKSADNKLARVQHTMAAHIANEHNDDDVDWGTRFGIDPALAKSVNKVNNVKKQHKKVQKDDDLEM
ncbi:MAG: hypothetical protein L0G21_08795 [Lactococcus raffinolactis]|nr:hypothetical protein [Lactococcus raffinolactis]